MKTLDWKGNFIVEPESPDSIINVWKFFLGSAGYDETYIRDYHQATQFATDKIEEMMDFCEEQDLLDDGIKFEVKLEKMRLSDYLELAEND